MKDRIKNERIQIVINAIIDRVSGFDEDLEFK